MIKKLLKIFLILILLLQYMVVPKYATKEEGKFKKEELPYDIEFTKIKSKYFNVCALDTDGNIWIWGIVDSDHIEEAEREPIQLTPIKLNNEKKFIDVTCGNINDLMAIDEDSHIWRFEDNGFIKFLSQENYVQVEVFNSQVRRGAALDENGCIWDLGTYLQKGYVGYSNKNPSKVEYNVKFNKISAGFDHLLALDENGYIWSGGKNQEGQLGNGTRTSYDTDIKSLTKIETEEIKFKDIYATVDASYALDNDGNIWAWGDVDYVKGLQFENYDYKRPSKVISNVKFQDIKDGIALDVNGKIWTFGLNNVGQLGNGIKNDNTQYFDLTQIMPEKTFKSISSSNGTRLAVDESGNTWVWGSHYLGDGTNDYSTVPIQLTGKHYTVNFYDEDGTTLLDTARVISGGKATTNQTPTKESTDQYTYTFEKWVAMDGSDIDLNNITKDINVKAKYTQTTKSYKVQFKNYDGTLLQEKMVNYGEKASYTGDVPTKVVQGYTVTFKGWDKDLNSTTITGETIFTAQYDEILTQYNITYSGVEGAQFEQENRTTYTIETEDFTLTNPTKLGYTFKGWDGTNITRGEKTVTIRKGSTGDRQYEALWSANTDTPYKVYHYKQKADDTYGTVPDEIEELQGTTGENVTATQKTYAGYIYDITASTPIGQIAGDGSLILKMYYKANTNTQYKVEHYLENSEGEGYTKDTEEIKYGKTGAQTEAQAKEYEGYTVQKFYQETIKGDGSTVIKIYYKKNADENTTIKYKVEYYLQNEDGTYSENANETEELEGKVGEKVNAKIKEYEGYVEDTENKNNLKEGTLTKEENLILKVYYKKDTSSKDDEKDDTNKNDTNKNDTNKDDTNKNDTNKDDINKNDADKNGGKTNTNIIKKDNTDKTKTSNELPYTGAGIFIIIILISSFIYSIYKLIKYKIIK